MSSAGWRVSKRGSGKKIPSADTVFFARALLAVFGKKIWQWIILLEFFSIPGEKNLLNKCHACFFSSKVIKNQSAVPSKLAETGKQTFSGDY
jgi:hypothetical protein